MDKRTEQLALGLAEIYLGENGYCMCATQVRMVSRRYESGINFADYQSMVFPDAMRSDVIAGVIQMWEGANHEFLLAGCHRPGASQSSQDDQRKMDSGVSQHD